MAIGRLRSRRVPIAFHHLALQCADLEACERFYREVLGLPVLRRWPAEGGGDRSVWLALEGGFLVLERAAPASAGGGRPVPGPWRGGRPGLHLVALRIPPGERAGWEARLAAAGVEVVRRTRWSIYFRDPEGNRVALSHYPEEAP
jgi:catechol 2,3-dioxygenase-like lactoylglutathione lyase family enzyme